MDAPAAAGVHVDAVTIANASPAAGAHLDSAANTNAFANVGACVDAPAKADAHVDAPTKLDVAILRMQAKDALTKLGWKPVIAQAAVTTASAALGADATVDRLIFEALRRCPRRSV